jgi:hypothetical protein
MGGGTYRLRKGLRRHWPWVLAGALGLAGMSLVTARLAWQLDRAETAERQALRAEAQALGVAAQARLAEQDALQQLGAARNAAAQGAQR